MRRIESKYGDRNDDNNVIITNIMLVLIVLVIQKQGWESTMPAHVWQ